MNKNASSLMQMLGKLTCYLVLLPNHGKNSSKEPEEEKTW